MTGALDRPGDIHHRPVAGHLPRQVGDALGVQAGNRRRPRRGFRYAIVLAQQISAIGGKPDGMAGNKRLVVERLSDQHIAQGQQQCGIGARPNGQPLGFGHRAEVIAHRTDIDKPGAVGLHLIQPVLEHMVIGATAVDLGIAQRQSADGDKQLTLPGQLGKMGMLPVQRAQRPENMRQNTLARGAAIGIGAGGVPAKALEKPVQLALRMVKASSAGPAVGAAVDRLIAAARLDRAQLARQQVQGHLPADFDKGLFTSPFS